MPAHCVYRRRPPTDDPSSARLRHSVPSSVSTSAVPRCKTLLEAHTGVSGQPGTCPTCAAHLLVPYVNPTTGKLQPAKLLDDDVQDPTPLHAYAASGTQAPKIHRLEDGTLIIECPRCETYCGVDADRCTSCGTPFTIDAAPTTMSGAAESRASAALALGVLSIPLFFLFLPAILAVILGMLSLRTGPGHSPSRAGIAGLILGALSLAGGAAYVLLM